jgi:hypothetical protein
LQLCSAKFLIPSPAQSQQPRQTTRLIAITILAVRERLLQPKAVASPTSDVASRSKSLSVFTPILPLEAAIEYSNSVSGF